MDLPAPGSACKTRLLFWDKHSEIAGKYLVIGKLLFIKHY
ncbi:Putative uncharacterized protein [Moritella viscosa]|nr:Putative uncharacterized protein [Moritella viscosa]SHO21444.1 Putative uncharacterized protein [Moritella viscosa]